MAALAAEGFERALEGYRKGERNAGEVACAFALEHLAARGGRRTLQAPRRAPFPCSSSHEAARLIATTNVLHLGDAAARALVGWASRARPGELLEHVPAARDVLAMQARGRRCVTLLREPNEEPRATPLDFAVHDLEHLEHFADPMHHRAQVGFFAALDRALASPAFAALERGLDTRWQKDKEHVCADMNGAVAFLFVALKSRLKLAVDRCLPGAFDDALACLLDALDLHGEHRDAARALTSKRDGEAHALRLSRAFAARAS